MEQSALHTVYLLLGGNQGDRLTNLQTATKRIAGNIGKVIALSSVYETSAWGKTDEPDFLNQVVVVETVLQAEAVMSTILEIEHEMGRVRTTKNASRIIDIDILFYDHEVVHEERLTIPHPEIQNRKFVLVPLAELAPEMVHPVLKASVNEMLSTTPDSLDVRLWQGAGNNYQH
jgi:2-amino-4-hydroxy-6-hydroxymethyldihydropteridine diphosphokinase